MDPALYPGLGRGRVAATTTTAVDGSYVGLIVDCSGTFAANFAAAATLGSQFQVAFYVTSGTVTLTGNGAETIQSPAGSANTFALTAGQGAYVSCDGTGLKIVLGVGLAPSPSGTITTDIIQAATTAGIVLKNSSGTQVASFGLTGTGTLLAGTLGVTGTSTFAAIDATSIGATAAGSGAFTTITASSTIVATNDVTGRTFNATNSTGLLGTNAIGMVVRTDGADKFVNVAGGNASNDGGNFICYGSTHATDASTIKYRIGSSTVMLLAASLNTISTPVTVSTSTAIGTPTSTQVFLGGGRGYFGNTGATSVQTAGGITLAGAITGATTIATSGNVSTSASTNATLAHTVTNSSTGSGASSRFGAINDQSAGCYIQIDGSGVSATRFGVTTAGYAQFVQTTTGAGSNGMMLGTATTVPIVFGTNNTLRMQISGAGNVSVNSAGLATTATDGFFYLPSCAGTPTGVPTAISNGIPAIVDRTNHKLYFYSGGAWRDAGP